MAKYMVLWEVDTSRTPEDPKAKKAQALAFQQLVANDVKEGVTKEWGAFAGEWRGYFIFEGNAVDLHTITAKWIPFVKFEASESLTIEEVMKATNALPE